MTRAGQVLIAAAFAIPVLCGAAAVLLCAAAGMVTRRPPTDAPPDYTTEEH